MRSEDNLADRNTKYLAKDRLEELRTVAGVIDSGGAERPRLFSLVKRNALGDIVAARTRSAKIAAILDGDGLCCCV